MLRVDFCDHTAATYAVLNWHYSQRMPVGPMVRIGAWERDKFIGCVLFARGNSPALGKQFDCTTTQVCELVRVALRRHAAPVTQIVAVALKLLRKECPGLECVVSFADPDQGHRGGIYQAGNWIYAGLTNPGKEYFINGRWVHQREASGGAFGRKRKSLVAGRKDILTRVTAPKHRYVFPLTKQKRKALQSIALPYPVAE